MKIKTGQFTEKLVRTYLTQKTQTVEKIAHLKSLVLSTDKFVTSYFGRYPCTSKNERFPTDYLQHERQKSFTEIKCMLSKNKSEDIKPLIANCKRMSFRYYLLMRHNTVVRTVWKMD